jgi:DNA-binding MarR family transcriptional regulator
MQPHAEVDYEALLAFRTALRRFHHWSEEQAKAVGLTSAQHQLLLAVKGHPGDQPPTIGDVAEALMLRHHSAVELINRAQAGGFLERHRDSTDARVVRLRLTAEGESKLEQLTGLHLAELRQLAPMLAHVVNGGELVHGPLG